MHEPSSLNLLFSVFSSDYYLKSNPDVFNEDIDPWLHYKNYGIYEGRLPCLFSAYVLDEVLWKLPIADVTCIIEDLKKIEKDTTINAALAAWVLARWYASFGEWQHVCDILPHFFSEPCAQLILNHQGPWLLLFTAYYQLGDLQRSEDLLVSSEWSDSPDKQLASAMLQRGSTKIEVFNEIWFGAKVQAIAVDTLRQDVLSLDTMIPMPCVEPSFAANTLARLQQLKKVTVIIPCFNAVDTIGTALFCLLTQTWQNIEILVVDDRSTDGSVEVIEEWIKRDKRIRLLRHTVNQGAYAARNTALKFATGHFITVHDSDDWSHPDKLKCQVNALQKNSKLQASVSHWVRCDNQLNFQRWRMEEGWIHRNVSSLMFRASVVKKIGFWDRVSVNADTEYYYRIQRVFGEQSIGEVLPGVPLAFGRVDASSLTQQSATHLRTQFSGVRRDYQEAAMKWQQSTSPDQLYLSASPTKRPFPVPSLICRGDEEQKAHNDQLLLQDNPLFDSAWYLEKYPDVQGDASEALRHYCLHGAEEGRDPSALFSTSGYRYAHGLSISQNPLVFWQEHGADISTAIPHLTGRLDWVDDAPCLLACGHTVSKQWFGAERSFLDVLTILSDSNINIVVALPSASSPAYIEAVRAVVHKLVILPYHWWHLQKEPDLAVIESFKNIIKCYDVAQVYVNTLVLSEPLLAADTLSVERVIHVRELPPADKALCGVLGGSPDEIRQHLLMSADKFIANSNAVASYINDNRSYVLPNMIHCAEYDINPMPSAERLSVGMLSSNLPKKGLLDFVALSQWCEAHQVLADFRLYGPDNEHITQLREDGQFQGNLSYLGYVDEARNALSELDIVVNLSHFQESFGRSVLEAMASQRCVVAYRWGALSELITPGCGFLVPFGEVESVGQYIHCLAENRSLLHETAKRGALMVSDAYGEDAFRAKVFSNESPFSSLLS
ncbi:glycosyltransferase [uncultured Amphritea sp.]|uniref:glycosyltransferase n=1 Tax=uncultured Amphritea sp. TaxID=981605 RepID=UPI002608DA61|nr:glycosyltransferase [uncultured Amphritea sp.]